MKKLLLFCCLSFLALGSGFSSGLCQGKESWTISKTLVPVLEDIQSEELIKSLASAGISSEFEKFEEALKPYEILKGKYFTIYLAPHYLDSYHIWILENPTTSIPFEDLMPDQLKELEQFRYVIGTAYQQELGFPGYLVFLDLKKDYGFGRPLVCLEMIPTKHTGKTKDELDIFEKIKRSLYVFYNEGVKQILPPQKAKPEVERIKAIIAHLPSLETQKRNPKNTLPWKRNISHWDDLKTLSLQELKKELLQQNALLSEETSTQQNHQVSPVKVKDEGEFTPSNDITKCAFCDPKVIENQFVHKFGDFVCLYNFRPYTPGYHFMVTSYLPLHVEDWQNFSLDDVLHIDQLAQAIVKAIKQESGRDDVILFIQNGLTAGMTVPHGHMHILLRPTKLHYFAQLLLEATGNKRKGLSAQEMNPTKTKFRNRLGHLLTPP